MKQRIAVMRTTALALTAALALGAALPGCAQFPELEESVSAAARAQPYPDLVPLEGLQAQRDSTRITPETVPTIEARAAALHARAARLSGSVIDADTHARMKTGVRQ